LSNFRYNLYTLIKNHTFDRFSDDPLTEKRQVLFRERHGSGRNEIERCLEEVALRRCGKSKGIALKLFLFMENWE